MTPWLEDALQALLVAQTRAELSDSLAQIVRLLGFDNFAFGLRMPYPLTAPKSDTINNYPSHWQTRYADNNYLAIDPTVQHSLGSTVPLSWSEDLFASTPVLWEEARSFGLNHGWTQSYRDASGNIGMLGLARAAEKISTLELLEKSAQLSWLTQLAYASCSKQMLPALAQSARPKLTIREIEILRWTADGKTSSDISIILSISERTVNFHIHNVMAKLQAANKTAATVQAALMGLI